VIIGTLRTLPKVATEIGDSAYSATAAHCFRRSSPGERQLCGARRSRRGEQPALSAASL